MARLVFLLLITCVTLSKSQVIPTKIYDNTNELSTSMVYYSILAEDNEMWFGTNKGLLKFNGYEFSDLSLSDGLTDTEIFTIEKTQAGNYWLLTNNGIPTIIEADQVKNANNDTRLSELPGGSFLWDVFESDSGDYWLGTQNDGIICMSRNNAVKSFFPDNNSSCFKIWESDNGNLSFALKKGIYELKGDSFELILTYPDQIHRRIAVLESGVYFSEDKKLHFYNELNSSKLIDVFSGSINFISQRDEESIWVGTTKALNIYHLSTSESEIYLDDINATSVTEDHEKGLWITSLDKGIFYFATGQPTLISIDKELNESIDNLFLRNGDLIIDNGISSNYNLKTKESNSDNIRIEGKVNDRVHHQGQEFIATTKGLYIVEKKLMSHLLADAAIEDIEFINDSTVALVLSIYVLVVPLNRLSILEVSGNILETIRPFIIYQNSKPYVVETTESNLWIGTVDGLARYSLKNNSLEPIPNSLKSVRGTINDLLVNQKILWIGTSGNGVFEYHNNSDFLIHHTTQTGLLSDFSQALKIDPKTKDLVSISSGGLALHQAGSWLPIPLNIPVNDGKNSICISGSDYFIASENKVFQFDPHQWINSIDSQVINAIQLFSSDIKQPQDESGNYTLTYSEQDITVEFISTSYRLNDLIRYEYVLLDDEEVVSSGTLTDRELQFPLLNPGEYQLSLWATNPYVANDPKSTINFIILPPFWQTWWFKLFITLLIGSVVYLFFKIRVLTYNRDIVKELLEAMVIRLKRDKKVLLKDNKGSYIAFKLKELLFIKAAENYVEVNCTDKRILVRVTMKKVEAQLENDKNFLRVHHSYIVNMEKVEELGTNFIKIHEHQIPISRRKRAIIELPKERMEIQ